MSRLRHLLYTTSVALMATGVLTATALAAPDRTFTFSAAHTAESWEGSAAMGFTPGGVYQCRAGGVYNCDDSLIDLKDAGTLKASGSTDADYLMNFELYKAAADGSPDGDPVAEGELAADFSIVAKDLEPAQYLLRIIFRLAPAADFTAKASFAPKAAPVVAPVAAPVVAPPPAPAAAPAPAAKPAAKKPSCKAKARKIKNAKKRKAALKRCARRK